MVILQSDSPKKFEIIETDECIVDVGCLICCKFLLLTHYFICKVYNLLNLPKTVSLKGFQANSNMLSLQVINQQSGY